MLSWRKPEPRSYLPPAVTLCMALFASCTFAQGVSMSVPLPARSGPAPSAAAQVPYYAGYSTGGTVTVPATDARPESSLTPPARRDPQVKLAGAVFPTSRRAPKFTPAPPIPGAENEDLPAPVTQENIVVPNQPQVADESSWTLSGKVHLAPAALEPTDLAFPINLATALKLADARPLVVAAAQAGAWVAEAELQRAKVLWVPTFNAGTDYIRHDGFGPDFNRGVDTEQRPLNQNINFLYSGIGLTMNVAMSDAIFQPLAARQTLNSRRWEIQTAKNDALLMTANYYFLVHQYRGQFTGSVDAVARGRLLVDRLTDLSKDLVPHVEVDRAKRQLAELEQNVALRREMWRKASADLTQILRLDPRVVVVPQEHDHLQVTLINADRPLDDLIPIGLTNRPELATQQALVRAVALKIRREKGRFLMPSLMLSGFQTPNELIQFGAQGFGFDGNMKLWSLRNDISPQAMWQYEGLGLGNMARIKEQRGEQSRAIIEQFKVQDAVAADITRAQARVQSAAIRVLQAERSVRGALITYDGNYEGLAETKRFGDVLVQVFRPQEAVIALQDLQVSYNNYFATVAEYNRAQFELFHALGYPAREVSALNAPGSAEPVNVSRPAYLPAVADGPPPATR